MLCVAYRRTSRGMEATAFWSFRQVSESSFARAIHPILVASSIHVYIDGSKTLFGAGLAVFFSPSFSLLVVLPVYAPT